MKWNPLTWNKLRALKGSSEIEMEEGNSTSSGSSPRTFIQETGKLSAVGILEEA